MGCSVAGQHNPVGFQPGGTGRCLSPRPRSWQDTGGVSHISAAEGWDGSVLVCLEDTEFSFPSIQTWPESIRPRTVQSFPKTQPSGVQGEADFAP